jgi:hypothetical protein
VAGFVAIVVAMSIVAHSSSDVLIARWFKDTEGEKAHHPHPATTDGDSAPAGAGTGSPRREQDRA